MFTHFTRSLPLSQLSNNTQRFLCIQLHLSPIVTKCPELEDPINGRVKMMNGRTMGSEVWYVCNPGFTLVGSETRRCQNNLQWAPAAPVCKRKELGNRIVKTHTSCFCCNCKNKGSLLMDGFLQYKIDFDVLKGKNKQTTLSMLIPLIPIISYKINFVIKCKQGSLFITLLGKFSLKHAH